MKRRDFILSTAALAGAMPSFARPARAGSFRLACLDRERNVFVDTASCVAGVCADTALRLRFDAFHPAETGAVLESLRVRVLFETGEGAPSPFLVWSHETNASDRNSRAVAFTAQHGGLKALSIDYRIAGNQAVALLAPASDPAGWLQPGAYALAGPRADGRAVDFDRFGYGGDRSRPLFALDGAPRAFDYLAFRIEPLA